MPEALLHLLLHFSNPIQSLMNTAFLPLSVIVYLVSTENLLVFVIAAMDVYDIVSDTNDCSLRCP